MLFVPSNTESHVNFCQHHHTFEWFLDKTGYMCETEIKMKASEQVRTLLHHTLIIRNHLFLMRETLLGAASQYYTCRWLTADLK